MALIKRYHKPHVWAAIAIAPGGSTTGRKDSRDLGSGLSSRPRRQPKNISQQRRPKSRAASISSPRENSHVREGRRGMVAREGRIAIQQPCKDGVFISDTWPSSTTYGSIGLTLPLIERVRDELCAKLGAKTISAVLTTCAAVFKLAQRRGWAANNPAAIAERPRRAVAELTVADANRRKRSRIARRAARRGT